MNATKSVSVDYGDRKLTIEVPESAVIAEFNDPPFLDDPAQAVREALAKPSGLPPLAEMARPGMRVAIAFDDITRPANVATTILPRIVDVLEAAGVDERDIVFINACANHRKNTRSELANHLGPEIFERFWPRGQIVNHDCDDPAGLRYFGVTEGGRVVEHNKTFFDADLQIYQGNVAAQPWRGFTGTGALIGLASTRSIASHHSLNSIPQHVAESRAGQSKPKPMGMKPEMSAFLETATGKPVFYVNAIAGTQGRIIDVFAGHANQITKPAWTRAEQIFRCDVPQADVLIIGLAQTYAYGHSNNALVATVGALVPPRFSPGIPILREGGVIIALSPSNGMIDPRHFPSYQEAVDLYGRYHNMRPLVDHEAEFAARPEYLHAYRHGYGYPALHPFWLLYEMEYALERAGAVYLAGVSNPGAFRDLSLTPVTDFQKAWQLARKHVGPTPRVVVAPTFWSRPRFKFAVEAGQG
ncbi:lactate racemase domain-containing protein [Variovorax sp. WS11]|uniref:lactate racemase domain-containing protein n=1 Tax=Variovorax sp. WS11 TaxID=1105204 RepID=UPI001950AE68|nr:lactate racemase domain-containing protein [Variovorax sp. WS11]